MAVIDTSSDVSGGIAILRERGVTAVGRYYSSSAWKRLTKREAERICDAGMGLFAVFENGGDPLLTSDSGAHDARIAMEQAKIIGQPEQSAIYFALEHLPDGYGAKHIPGVKKYIQGVKSVLDGHYAIGVYSDGVICKALLDGGLIDYAWLSASTAFPGSKEFYKSGAWSLAQRQVDLNWGRMSIDTNEAKPEFGGFSIIAPESMMSADSEISNGRSPGDVDRISRLVEIGDDPATIAEVQALAAKTMATIGYKYPTKSCAATLSHFLRTAGIDVPITTGAQNLADRLRLNRKWARVKVGSQQPGDVGVCASLADDVPGADHIYLVVERVDDDLMVIADNQVQGRTHRRSAAGKGGKTPTEYFLRAPDAGGAAGAMFEMSDDAGWPDEPTNGLPEPFMDDGASRFEAA